jgi:hypothetical protein
MYFITTFCFGNKYGPILSKWSQRIKEKCKNGQMFVLGECNVNLKYGFGYAWWDVVRMHNNIHIISSTKLPVNHIDMDLIVEKDVESLVNLKYDLIFSREIGGNQAFPKECSSKLGFGICSGFYIMKPSALEFMTKIFELMSNYTYNSYSDQVTIMNYIVNNKHVVYDEKIVLDGIEYTNKIVEVDGIKICVLDFNIIVRDPVLNINQFGNHINIDNVGGTQQFLRYFDEDLETLPLTCRCGKTHLGDNTVCTHIALREKRGVAH